MWKPVVVKRTSLIVILWLLCWQVRPAIAVLGVADTAAVFDATNWQQTFITASNMVMQVSQTLQLVQASIANLTIISNMAAVNSTISQVQEVAAELTQIADKLAGRSSLWGQLTDEENLPTSESALAVWNQQASQLAQSCAKEAIDAQALLRGAAKTLEGLQQLASLIGGLSGNLAALQAVNTQMAKLVTETTRMETTTASFHQAMMSKDMIQHVNERASYAMAQARMEGWGDMVKR